MSFGRKLRKTRKDKGITQKQLADVLGVSESSVCDWEHDRHKPDRLDIFTNLCIVLNVPSKHFLGI